MRGFVVATIVTAILAFVYFYFTLPALNIHNPDAFIFVGAIIVVWCSLYAMFSTSLRFRKKDEPAQEPHNRDYLDVDEDGNVIRKRHAHQGGKKITDLAVFSMKVPLAMVIALVVIFAVGVVSGLPILRARSYSDLLVPETGDFTADVAEISYNQIPMLDSASAQVLADRKLGELSDLVSQFEVDNSTTQINLNDEPVRVTYLNYGDAFKWLNNFGDGIPAYIVIDMTTQEVTVQRLEQGIRYSPSEYFFRDILRHLRFSYPTKLFGDVNFEVNEEGHPYWVASVVTRTIGLFGGEDVIGAVLVDAVSGETTYYDVGEVPTWCDRVYPPELLTEQYNYHGLYHKGFLNSIFGQSQVTVTTSGYNYIALNDDVWMYTGITSVSGDESNVGFILVNQRTKEAKYYPIAGATEESAMRSAQGAVQQFGYQATFPLLLNVSGQPTYFMALKDASQLVKQYAMVNVQQYNVVGTGSSVAECERNYIQLLGDNNIEVETEELDTVIGTITDIRSAVLDGDTRYFIRLNGADHYYMVSIADAQLCAILNVGDRIAIGTMSDSGELRNAYSVERN
ncbi:MAG: CvpA family protein [Oscillospiraceae bacterium]|nr:CvpA family protein [Oscillospiraceae bacterium]